MTVNKTSAEDFIYDPNTVALIIDSEATDMESLRKNPDILLGPPMSGDYLIAYVNRDNVESVVTDIERYTSSIYPLVLGLLGEADLSAAGISQVQNHPVLNLRGRGVLLGFVDTGIDYTQEAFKYEDGTSKIQYIWDQTIPGKPPEGYLYGSEYTNAEINAALKSDDPKRTLPHTDRGGHGTFLASLAGSRAAGASAGAAPDAEIVMVKMRRAKPSDYKRFLIPSSQENAFASNDFMLGVQYIASKAQELKRPAAICISVGTNLGSHDGFTTLERYLYRISSIIGTAVCAAAGNESQVGHHIQGKLALTGSTQDIELRVSDKQQDVYITVWNNATDRLSVSVKSPAGEIVSRVPARSGISYTSQMVLERASVTVEYLFPVESSGGQLTRVKILSATPGVWTVTVYGDLVLDGAYHAWLPLTGFIDPGTVFLSPTPYGTVVTPGTSLGIIACGAYDVQTGGLYSASSWGPSRLPATKPDLAAPGVKVGGIFPTGLGSMSGTSAAAAITAGACALLLEWGIVQKNDTSLDSFRVRATLIAGCARDPNIEYPNNQWGYGKLDLMNTFRTLRPL
ncbi:MAG: S8 family peptidase [Oscillospiraceae bacterium]|jgi:hypothetical protein|nr:S8 family peptidase [Oscillospiraceae bacterium]